LPDALVPDLSLGACGALYSLFSTQRRKGRGGAKGRKAMSKKQREKVKTRPLALLPAL